jgi:mono/diheme cytochrome c family protein
VSLLAKVAGGVLVLALAAGATAWFLSAPERLDRRAVLAAGPGDAVRGERMFWAGGCASCHARPRSEGEARLELAGGLELETPFGVFVPPNISSDPESGIGSWSLEEFANAMMRGVSPSGEHYYPAFPYASYARMTLADVADLHAFMKTLPAVAGETSGHRLEFPYGLRRGLGLWKRLYLSAEPVIALAPDAPADLVLGRYLVEGPGHCGECHTPRDSAGGPLRDRWLAGAPAAAGSGVVANITSGDGGIAEWSAVDIASFLETGFTPEFDSAGGAMAEVVKTTARLTGNDREAIAAYLKAVPPQPNGYPPPAAAPQN